MKHHFIGQSQEKVFTIIGRKSLGQNHELWKVESGNEVVEIETRRIAQKWFYKDSNTWNLFPILHSKELNDSVESYKVYRGFKPAGLFEEATGDLVTQMPGKVVKLFVEEGDSVQTGQTLLILEAMKMENEIKSSVEGVVKAIHVKAGDSLEAGTLMLEVE